MKDIFNKANLPRLILLFVTAVAITVTTVLCGQSFIRIIPLYVSLFIGLLQSRVNRYAPLIGGVNSIFYALVYFYYGLTANAFYALLFSFPLQIITFIRWTRNKQGSTTTLRKMRWWQRGVVLLGFAVAYVTVVLILKLIGSEYAILDTATSMLGILVSFLTMFAFVEYTVLQLVSGTTNIVLYVAMILGGTMEQVPYLIFSFYSMICLIIAVPTAMKLYAAQRAKREAERAEG